MGRMQNSLPMVRGTILLPILRGLAELDFKTDVLLKKYDLEETSLRDPGNYVHNDTVYRIYAEAAELAGDPGFCASQGSRVDLTKMLAFGNHLRDATTIGDFIIRFTQAVASDTTSISQSLLIEDSTARFGARRQFVPETSPAHSDAFMVGLWVNFLHRKVDYRWDPSRVAAFLCDPKLLPANFHRLAPIQNDGKGFSVQFPAAWLSLPLVSDALSDHRPMGEELDHLPAPNFIEAIRAILKVHIGETDLTVSRAAKLCGFSKSSLTRRLATRGTTIDAILRELKLKAAKEMLLGTDQPIRDIALSLGYSDATAFTRAFKKTTGVAPTQYRAKHGDNQ